MPRAGEVIPLPEPMLLAIDVGNTQTAVGVYSGAQLLHEWRVTTAREATVDELAAHHDQILRLRGASLAEVDAMVIGSVVPPLTGAYRSLAARYIEREALVVGPGVRSGISVRIDNPHELGADRLVNAVAAYARHAAACIIVDFGTATTFDAVSGDGEYLGGVIAPGIETSLEALSSRAARLVKVDLVMPPRVIGKSTVECMQSGLIHGAVAMVDGIVVRMKEEFAAEAIVIATGGLAGLVAPESVQIDEHDPQLTLDGLRQVFALNAGRPR